MVVKAVTEHDHWQGRIVEDAYIIDVELLPPDFLYLDSVWENDDRSIHIGKQSGSVWCRVFEPDSEIFVAYHIFAADELVVRCDDIYVDAAHRRRGIADQLYEVAACLFEAPVVPSDSLLTDGELFWRGRDEIVCPLQPPASVITPPDA